MTPTEIAEAQRVAREARERAEKATPAPWKLWGMAVMADPTGTSDVDKAVHVAMTEFKDDAGRPRTNNADFICAARSDVPALAALVERMAGELARLPSAERVAEMRERVEEALEPCPCDMLELLRLLAEDLSDVLDAIAPPPTKIT